MLHKWVNIRSSQRHFICICRGNIIVVIGKNYCCCVAEKIVNSGEDNKQVYELIHLVLLNAHFSNEINSIAALTNYYRFRKEYLVNLMPYFERSIEGFFSMRICALCELLISLISLFNSIIFRTLVMSFIHHYKINLLTFLLYARGLLL